MIRNIIPVFFPHFGCGNSCVFCNQNKISGGSGRPSVRAEIESALPAAGDRPQIAFYGGSFTAIDISEQESYLAEAARFIEDGRADSIRLSTRPDCIDEAVLSRLNAYHVKTIELGLQSMDDEVLRLSKRGHTSEDSEKAVRLVRGAGFELVLQMMTGLPGDDGAQSRYTAECIVKLQPDAVRIYPAVVLPKTELCTLWEQGAYKPQSVEEAVELCSELLEIFETAQIPVIRIGLNPSEELDREALAGAYHPALGDLARSRLYLKKAERLLSSQNVSGAEVTLGVAKNRVSTMIGYKRENLEKLRAGYGLKSVNVIPSDIADGEIVIISRTTAVR